LLKFLDSSPDALASRLAAIGATISSPCLCSLGGPISSLGSMAALQLRQDRNGALRVPHDGTALKASDNNVAFYLADDKGLWSWTAPRRKLDTITGARNWISTTGDSWTFFKRR